MILMVSFNDGVFYHEFMESDDLEVLLKRTEKMDGLDDISWTRWYIEENGVPRNDIICPVHRNMMDTFKKLNKTN